MSTETNNTITTPKASDYIKSGNGKSVIINNDGIKLLKDFVAKNGGNKGVSKLTGYSENTISKLLNDNRVSPDTWIDIFQKMQTLAA